MTLSWDRVARRCSWPSARAASAARPPARRGSLPRSSRASAFLGIDVITKQGGPVSGLNTAATLWASAAVGSLAGGGLYGLAIAGTGVVMLANTALRPLGRALDRRTGRGGEEEALDYSLEVRCQAAAAVDLRPLLVRSLHGPGSRVLSLETRDTQPDGAAIVAHVRCGRDAEDRLESAMGAVSRLPAVTAVLWRALDVESPD
jgi:putative Mg2+ transporter-C (MgtC) family protein